MNREKLFRANELHKEIECLKNQLAIATNGERLRSTTDVYNPASSRFEDLSSRFIDFEVLKAIVIQRITKELNSKTEEFENL